MRLQAPTADDAARHLDRADGDEAFLAIAERVRHLSMTDVPAALRLADDLIQQLPANASERARSRCLVARAHALGYATRFADAIADLRIAESLANSGGHDAERGLVALAMVQPLAMQGDLEQADAAGALAHDCFARCGDRAQASKAMVNRGIILRMRGMPAEAVACFDRAAAGLDPGPFPAAVLQSNRAEALLDLERHTEAAASFEAALAGFTSDGRAHAAAIVQGNLADLLSRTGRVDESLLAFEDAQSRFRAADAPGEAARLRAEQADALRSVGAFRRAVEAYDEAIATLEPLGMAGELGRARFGRGIALLRLGRREEARLSLQAARADAPDAAGLAAECAVALAHVAAADGDSASAVASARQAIAALQGNPLRQSLARLTEVEVQALTLPPSHAIELLERVTETPIETQPAPVRVRFGHLRGQLLCRAGDARRGLEVLRDSMMTADRYRASIRGEQLRLTYLESSKRLYQDVIQASLDQSDGPALAPCFDAWERLRSRTLLDAVAGAAEPAPESGSSDRLSTLNYLYATLGRDDAAPAVADRIRAAEATFERDADARAATASFTTADPLALDEAASRLPEGSGVLGLIEDDDHVSLLLLTRAGLHVRRHVVTRTRLAALARRFAFERERCLLEGERRRSACDDVLHAMRRETFGPVHDAIAPLGRLWIVPLAGFEDIPWHAAGDPRRIESFVPGVTIGLRLGARTALQATPSRAVVVGVADEDAPMIENEVRSIAQCWPESHVLCGNSATAKTVCAALREANFTHLAGHAVFDPEHPMSSRIKVADRWISARELTRCVTQGSTVILATCESGRSSRGVESLGLVRALLAGGAAAVVNSLWRLHDQASLAAFTALHRDLAARRPPAGAKHALAPALARVQHDAATAGMGVAWWGGICVTDSICDHGVSP